MQIGIIGLGLIGGSIALELNSQIGTQVFGWDRLESHRIKALELDLVSGIKSEDEILRSTDLVILAIPVNQIEEKLPALMHQLNENQFIIDVGSTKKSICTAVKDHPMRKHYVAAHPLAGTEFSGPTAAHRGLFQKKKNIICDQELSLPTFVDTTVAVFKSMGMNSIFLNSEEHDKHLAYVSHLSHISSFMLGHTVLELEKDEKQIFNLASTGFASTVRLAKSSPKMWADIFIQNSENIVEVLNTYINQLQTFKDGIEEKNYEYIFNEMLKANEIKRILK